MNKITELLKTELIGRNTVIIDAKNKANIGIEGKIIDETKYTLTVETKKGKKKLIKQNITIEIKHDNKKIKINGKILTAAPEERIKIKVK